MLALVRGFLSAGDEIHIHTYKVDKDFADGIDCTIHKSNFFYLPRRLQKYAFLKECNENFDRGAYDLTVALTRTFSADIAIIGGVHPASIAADKGKRHYVKRFHDTREIRFEQEMFDRVPHIVAHSRSIAHDICLYYPDVDPTKISVVYPPVDTGFFNRMSEESVAEVQQQYQIDVEKMNVLFPSTGHKRKGMGELLEAFSQLDPHRFELLVVGESLRHFSKIPENVRYLGYIDNLSKLYSAVNYTVLPSHYEPFGLAVVESLECGTPVIVTKSVGAAELLSGDEAVILEDNRPETLADAMRNLERKSVEAGFVQRHGLSISEHIQYLKNLAGL